MLKVGLGLPDAAHESVEEPLLVIVEGEAVKEEITGAVEEFAPGGPHDFEASSRTRTQSFVSGAANVRLPFVPKLPIEVAAPDLGLNHQALSVVPEIFVRSMVGLSDPCGRYTNTVAPLASRVHTA
jgi:hypothetical protein